MASTSMMRSVLNSAHAKLEARIYNIMVCTVPKCVKYWPIDTTRFVYSHSPITTVTLMEAIVFKYRVN